MPKIIQSCVPLSDGIATSILFENLCSVLQVEQEPNENVIESMDVAFPRRTRRNFWDAMRCIALGGSVDKMEACHSSSLQCSSALEITLSLRSALS